jgi:signal transduction histidine kinase
MGYQRFAIGTVEVALAELAAGARDGVRDGMREDEVAQIVHDLKGPLAAIALEAYLLTSGDHSDLGILSARILRNVQFLDRMIQDLLDSCSIGDGRFELHRRPTELRALLEQVVDRIASTRDRGRVVLEAPFRITLSIDDLRIERVVANLVGNALKHAPRCNRIVVELAAGAHGVEVSVTDTGPGISAAEIGSIFDKHRRGDAAHAVGGHGLGLYASKKIVEAHGGRIGVDSTCGAGSRFFFELPGPTR